MQLQASEKLYKELNIVRRVRRLRSVGVLLKALSKTVDTDKIIDTCKYYPMKEKNESSSSDDGDSVSSGEDKILYNARSIRRASIYKDLGLGDEIDNSFQANSSSSVLESN